MKGIQFTLQKIISQIHQILIKPTLKLTPDIFQINYSKFCTEGLKIAQMIINHQSNINMNIQKHIPALFQRLLAKLKEARQYKPEGNDDDDQNYSQKGTASEDQDDQVMKFLNSRRPIQGGKNYGELDWYAQHMSKKQQDTKLFLQQMNRIKTNIQPSKLSKQPQSHKCLQTDITWLNSLKIEQGSSLSYEGLVKSIPQLVQIITTTFNKQQVKRLQQQIQQYKQRIQEMDKIVDDKQRQIEAVKLENLQYQKAKVKIKPKEQIIKNKYMNKKDESKRVSQRSTINCIQTKQRDKLKTQPNKLGEKNKNNFSIYKNAALNNQPLIECNGQSKLCQYQQQSPKNNEQKVRQLKQQMGESSRQKIASQDSINFKMQIHHKQEGNSDELIQQEYSIYNKKLDQSQKFTNRNCKNLQGLKDSIQTQEAANSDFHFSEPTRYYSMSEKPQNHNHAFSRQINNAISQAQTNKMNQSFTQREEYQFGLKFSDKNNNRDENSNKNLLNKNKEIQKHLKYNQFQNRGVRNKKAQSLQKILRLNKEQNNQNQGTNNHQKFKSQYYQSTKPLKNGSSFYEQKIKLKAVNNNYLTRLKPFMQKNLAQKQNLPSIHKKNNKKNKESDQIEDLQRQQLQKQILSGIQNIQKINQEDLIKRDLIIRDRIHELQKNGQNTGSFYQNKLSFYVQLMQKLHKKYCGEGCKHLQRFYRQIRNTHGWNNRIVLNLPTRQIGFFS